MPDLVACNVCNVVVHPACYEINLATTEQRDSFTCWACQAVGTTVKFRERDVRTGNRLQCRIGHRPKACCLCNAPDPEHAHAMHPLFDDYGPRARQIRLPNNQPAWVHTLCALILAGQSGGLVYACSRQGNYAGQEDGDPERVVYDDDSSINSALVNPEDDEGKEADQDLSSTHHFTYGRSQAHVKYRRERAHLVCRGCKQDGRNDYSLAIQCMVGEDNEFKKFKNDKNGKAIHIEDSCSEPWHVGCARYLKNKDGAYPGFQTVFFYPGDDKNAPVCNIFCPVHALDVYENFKQKGEYFDAKFPPGTKVAPVESQVEAPSSQEDDDFQMDDDGDDDDDDDDVVVDDDDDDDDDEDRMDSKPKARGREKTAPLASPKGSRNGGPKNPPARALKRPPPAESSIERPSKRAKRPQPEPTKECSGLDLAYYRNRAKSNQKKKIIEIVFGCAAAEAMESLSAVLRKGEQWPYSSACIGALSDKVSENERELTWSTLRLSVNDSRGLQNRLSFHAADCFGTFDGGDNTFCPRCGSVRKKLKAVMLKHVPPSTVKSEHPGVAIKTED
eukprot:scaffold5317_cov160-Amphora_coffeaeformis.AAC.14